MNPQGGRAEEAKENIETNQNERSPQQSLESILQRPLPLFPLTAESQQMFLDWIPQAQMNLPQQQGPSTNAPLHESSNEALEYNNSPSSSLIGTPQGFPNRSSNDVDLSLTLGVLGREAAIRSPTNNVAPRHEVQEQGVHRGTSTNVTLLPSKRRSGEFEFGGSSNMGEQASLPKRRVTANINVNPSQPSLDLMQRPFSEIAHTESHVSANNNMNPLQSTLVLVQQPFSETARTGYQARATNNVNSSPLSLHLMQQSGRHYHVNRLANSYARGVVQSPLHGQASLYLSAPNAPRVTVADLMPPLHNMRNAHGGIMYTPHVNYQHFPVETRTRLPSTPHSIVDRFRNVRPRTSEHVVLDRSLIIRAFEQAGFPTLFDFGNPRTGLSVKTIMQHIKHENFVSSGKEDPEDEEKCVICQEEYEDGEEIGKLDLCVHKFHVPCITQWLMNKNACPICQRTALTMNNVENEAGAS